MRRARPVAYLALLALGASAGTTSYTLKWGDTLARVSKKTGVAIEALKTANKIENPNKVREGQVLVIPKDLSLAKPIVSVASKGAADPAPSSAAPGTTTHVVKPGETLSQIAKTYGATVAQLLEMNSLANANRVREGRELMVPDTGPPPLCPVTGATRHDISDSFGAPRPGSRRHNGNDVFAKRGTTVIASAGGTIRFANGKVAGNAFYLEGDDGTTYYGAHLQEFAVGEGRVERGQVIGRVGRTGNAEVTPPHLHFEVKPKGGPSVDPHGLLSAWCR